MWPLAFRQIQISVEAGGTAKALMRFSGGVFDAFRSIGLVSEGLA
jgi:hypothetical protein